MKTKFTITLGMALFHLIGMAANTFYQPENKTDVTDAREKSVVINSVPDEHDEMDDPAAAHNVTLNGYITDKLNGEVLIGATVYVSEAGAGAASNGYGYYSLIVNEGTYTVSFSYLGYETQQVKLTLKESTSLNISLSDKSEKLDEVLISAEKKNNNVERVEMSMVKMPVKMVKKLPSFMGEVDILKSIQMLPGIQSGGEGSSGLYVRGGGPDENLLILDEAPVYNASH